MSIIDDRQSWSWMLAMRRRSSRVFLFLSLLGLFLIVLILLNAPAFEDVAAKKGLSFEREVQSDSAAPNGKRKKVLLMWTSVFGLKTANLDDCPLKDYCTLTFDHNLVEDADAVLFHMDPSEFDWALIPRLRHIHQRYIFLLQEAPHLDYQFDSNVVPGFFNWTMTYRLDSDCPMPYGGWWIRPEEKAKVSPEALSRLDLSYNATAILAQKTSLIVWLVSNCHTTSKRELVVEALQRQQIQVDIFGACAPTADKKNFCPKSDGAKCNAIFSRYKFFIAFENANCKDYVTEKYWDRWNSMSVPIVMRRWTYETRIPNNSFIAVDDFENAAALANHLRYLDANNTAYMEYFKWRDEGYDKAQWNGPGYRLGYCRVCENLLKDDEPPKVINDIAHWFKDEARCEKGEFAEAWSKGRYKRV